MSAAASFGFRLVATWIAVEAAGLGWPMVEHARFAARLAREAPPAQLPVPVLGVAPRALRDSWGAPRSGGRAHQGIDIFARRGTPVVSATHGIVLRVGADPLGGRVVWVLGPGGRRHYYAHLDRPAAIRAGERVAAGTVLGFVGDTGNAKGGPPHLHYGIYVPAQGAVNPYPLLAPRAGPR